MTDNPSPDAARDELHLQAVRDARAAGDLHAAREAMGQLLGPYWDWARLVAYAKLDQIPNRDADARDVAQSLIERLVKTLNKKLTFTGPFHVVATMNLKWAIDDYWRDRYGEQAVPHDPGELPDDRDTDARPESAWQQAVAFEPYLAALNERERELVIERIFLDMTPTQIATRHDMSREAVDTAVHRAFKKLRGSTALDTVRKRYEGTA